MLEVCGKFCDKFCGSFQLKKLVGKPKLILLFFKIKKKNPNQRAIHQSLINKTQITMMIGMHTALVLLGLFSSFAITDSAKVKRIRSGKVYEDHEDVHIVVNKVG